MGATAGTAYGRLLQEIHRADLLSRRIADLQLTEQIGIGRAMFLMLEMLSDAGTRGPSQQAIADRIGLTKAAVSRHVLAAQAQGWLVARPSAASRRQNNVTLTAAGRALVERGRKHRVDAARLMIADLDVAEMERTALTLARLAASLERRLAGRASHK